MGKTRQTGTDKQLRHVTVERIVHLAMKLADTEGLEAVSMRRIAAELESGVMSLYYHVPAKGELLDLLLDAAFAEVQVPEHPSGDWRGDLRELALGTRECFKRHAWVLVLLNTRAALGPSRLSQTEYILRVVSEMGLEGQAAWRAIRLFFVYILGSMVLELSDAHAIRLAECRKFDGSLPGPLATGKYPALARQHAEGSVAASDDENFEAGLNLALEGIASLRRTRQGD